MVTSMGHHTHAPLAGIVPSWRLDRIPGLASIELRTAGRDQANVQLACRVTARDKCRFTP